MITFINYSKSIKGKSILDNINFKFDEGKIYLLTGHNGCGKTMIIRAMCNLMRPTSGEVKTDKNYLYGAVIENSAFLENETALYNLKYLSRIRNVIGTEQIENALRLVNLYEFKDKKVKTFSLGMKQRLGICQAFMENPDVILLDEPFNALDADNEQIIINLLLNLKRQKKIIVVAAHGIEDTSIFDCIIKMNNGKIVEIL